MRRLLAFLGGVLSGGAIGTAVALLFTPRSGDSMRQGVRSRYADAIKAGEAAAAQKRAELEAQLNEIAGVALDTVDQL
ncbi:MAG: YtxH domain-containing protein [Anaerolineae bacterium]|nr:YtxH domain-containing protein [Anaerolineae bacterium]